MPLEYPNPIERNINSTDPIGKVLARLEDLKIIIDYINNIVPGGGTPVGVQGTGTVGTIARFTPNGTSIGNSQLIDDGITTPTVQGLIFGRGNNNEIGNVAFGFESLSLNPLGIDGNSGFGYQSLKKNLGASNSGFGFRTLAEQTTGMNNTAGGVRALENNLIGQNTTALGYFAGRFSLGDNSTFIGASSGLNQTTGINNTYIGFGTGLGVTTGGGNTILGANVSGLAAGLTNNVILADGTGTIRLRFNNEGTPDFVGATVTTETVVSDTTIIVKVAGVSYKVLAIPV
jgi:hypothetical protein